MNKTKSGMPLWSVGKDAYKTPVPAEPFIFYCGCGGMYSKLRRAIVGTKAEKLTQVKISASPTAKRFVELKKLPSLVKSLGTGSYAVLYANGKLLDLNVKQAQLDKLREKIQELLDE